MNEHLTEITVFSVLFLLVSGMGFVAARWRRPDNLASLDEWGLGGRSFGTWVTWFLVGGDLYTAYTFVAVPALMFGARARWASSPCRTRSSSIRSCSSCCSGSGRSPMCTASSPRPTSSAAGSAPRRSRC